MCETCIQKARSAVRVEGTVIFLSFFLSFFFFFFLNKTSLKQGDPLSPILFNLALQKVIQSIEMVPSGIKTGKEQLNVLAYADDIALIGKN